MFFTELFESKDVCPVCGQTPCNCTSIKESIHDDDCHLCKGTGEGLFDGESCPVCDGTGIEPKSRNDDDFVEPDDYDDADYDDESYYEKSLRNRGLGEQGVAEGSEELAKQHGWEYKQGNYGGASMTHPKHGRISLSSPITSKSGDTAVEREWTHNMSSGVGDRSLAQHLQSLKEQDVTEGGQQKGADYRDPPEADYGDDYQAMVKRLKHLAGAGPLKTQYDPNKRVYKNVPTAVQPKK